jgi:tetratricopeptide (TPR) repeat protein
VVWRECRQQANFPVLLRPMQMLDFSTEAAEQINYEKLCTPLGGAVVLEVSTAMDRTKLPPVSGRLPKWNRMPYRSMGSQFVGRVEALWEIYDALHRDSTVIVQGVGVLAGTGGLGKTQAAIEYVHRFGSGYPGGVYWVDADRGLSTLITQVSEAGEIEIDGTADEKRQVEQIWRELNRRAASLLVLDNFPEDVALRPYLPTAGPVHALVTTRQRDLGTFRHVRLNMLTGEAGIALLNSGERQVTRDEAAGLVERLGGLPLALELTRAFLDYRRDASVRQVLAEMEESGDVAVLGQFAAKYKGELPNGHEADVVKTFQMSWALAPKGAQDVLRVMAELAPVGVPVGVIREVLGVAEAEGLGDEVRERVSELVRLSLVELDVNGNPVMHRLVHGFVGYRSKVDGVSFFEKAAQVVLRRMDKTFENPGADEFRELELLVGHAEEVLRRGRLGVQEDVDLLGRVGSHHQDMGRLSLARRFSKAALEKAEKGFAAGHQEIAVRQSNLALVLRDLGELEEARDLLRKALAASEKTFSAGHPMIAMDQSNLATVLLDLGELEEARVFMMKALAADEKSFPAGHSTIALRRSNLEAALQEMERKAKAAKGGGER